MADSTGPRTGSIVMLLLVCASLGLNTFLGAKFLQRRPSPPLPTTPTTTAISKDKQLLASSVALQTPDAAIAAPATNALPPFLWSQIESADYRQYIANLRAVGCPEQVIRDIVTADLNQAFAARFAAIWKPEIREYWQKSKREQPSPEQEKQLMALDKERADILQELLGVRLEGQRWINTIFLQVFGNEQNLLFLPADKREAALQALADGELERKAEELRLRRGYSNEVDQKLHQEAVQLLDKVLSPAELEEFRLRASPVANSLRNEVQYFNCTPEEFRQLLDARENTDEKSVGDLMNRTAATEQVRKLFGGERAKEFERVTDMFYINARRAGEEQGVALELVDQAWQVTRDTRTAADSVWKNKALSTTDRGAQLEALRQQAEVQLRGLLGSKAASGVVRDLHLIVNASAPQ